VVEVKEEDIINRTERRYKKEMKKNRHRNSYIMDKILKEKANGHIPNIEERREERKK
jgi:hypothetical protein